MWLWDALPLHLSVRCLDSFSRRIFQGIMQIRHANVISVLSKEVSIFFPQDLFLSEFVFECGSKMTWKWLTSLFYSSFPPWSNTDSVQVISSHQSTESSLCSFNRRHESIFGSAGPLNVYYHSQSAHVQCGEVLYASCHSGTSQRWPHSPFKESDESKWKHLLHLDWLSCLPVKRVTPVWTYTQTSGLLEVKLFHYSVTLW